MNIKGNTVGTIMPRTNYNQTDPTKPDYLEGRDALEQKIADAKKAGTDAYTVAGDAKKAAQNVENNALLKSGGKMTGNIDMNGKHITNLPTPSQDSDIITKKFMEDYINNTFLGGAW